jgi:acetoacetate decarboxylase
MRGQMWLSLFRAEPPEGPRGLWGAAWVAYEPGSALTYSELLVARPVRVAGGRRVSIRDIWVDSVPSRDGGRALWGIPKDLAAFRHEGSGLGPVRRASWSASTADGRPIASADLADAAGLAPVRLPFRAATWQRRDGGAEVQARMRGRTRAVPCLAHWEFADDGPLGWLAGKQPLVSFRLRDFAMDFG